MKHLFISLLSILLILTLTACNKEGAKEQTSSTPDTTEEILDTAATAAATTTAAEETTAEASTDPFPSTGDISDGDNDAPFIPVA